VRKKVRERVATLLTRREDGNEGPTPQNSPSSGIEREVLELLRRSAGYPPSLRELRSKLLPFFTELQIQDAIMDLIDEGVIATVREDGNELGFAIALKGSPLDRGSR